jgi:hypothetical protein
MTALNAVATRTPMSTAAARPPKNRKMRTGRLFARFDRTNACPGATGLAPLDACTRQLLLAITFAYGTA